MKKILLVLIISVAMLSLANAASIFYEDFNYSYGALTVVSFASAPNNWVNHSGTAPLAQWSTMNVAGFSGNSLAYVGLTTPSGDRIYKDKAYTEDMHRTFSASQAIPGTLYYSMLVKPTTLPTAEHYFASFMEGTGFTIMPARLFYKTQGTNANFGISFKAATGTYSGAVGYATNQTHLIVVKLVTLNGTGNDNVAIWVDPTSLGGSEPTADATADSGGASNCAAAIYGFGLRAATANAHGNLEIDEIRVGTTWADVTPTVNAFVPVELSDFNAE